MALRTQTNLGALLALTAGLAAAQPLQWDVTHDHWRKNCAGTLTIDERGVRYQQRPAKTGAKTLHAFDWPYVDIQQLLVEPGRIRVLTYRDVRRKLGADQQMEFLLPQDQTADASIAFLRERLGRRLTAAAAEDILAPLWQLPVKHLALVEGSEGDLLVAADRIVFRTGKPGDARTWLYTDIENVSSEGPFELTITTFERSRAHYGSRKDFHFQLKEPLAHERYEDLWRRLHVGQGLGVLDAYRK